MKVVSLFSGAGGLDLGFRLEGHDIIWAVDNYKDACETYEANLGGHIKNCSIEEIPSCDIPNCDMVIGGFPCQGFSVANTKRSLKDSRNKLYKEFLRVVKDKTPKYFVAENVKGLLSLDRGSIFNRIISDFNQIGYRVSHKILNAADYGVPQIRERVIIVGIRNDIDFDYVFPRQTHYPLGCAKKYKNKIWVSVGKALSALPDPDKPNNVPNHTYSKFKLKFNGYLGNREIDPDLPAPTVTGRGDDKGGVVVLHHPSNLRRMTARELATVQSFPLDFVFSGCRSSVYRQIANAVPPLMAKNIAQQFRQ